MTTLVTPNTSMAGQPPRGSEPPTSRDTGPRSEAHRPSGGRFLRMLRYIPLALAVIGDTALAIPAFDAVLQSYEILSWICAFAFSVLTVTIAFLGGRQAKLEHGGLVALLATANVMLIAAIFVMRMMAASLQAVTGPSYAGSAPTSNGSGTEVALAWVMALVMLAGSIAAWIDGFSTTLSPAATEYKTSQAHLMWLESLMAPCRASIARLADDSAWATYQLDRVDRDLAEALHGLEAATREMQAHARFEIARVLSTPTATSGLDLPINPDATGTTQNPEED